MSSGLVKRRLPTSAAESTKKNRSDDEKSDEERYVFAFHSLYLNGYNISGMKFSKCDIESSVWCGIHQ